MAHKQLLAVLLTFSHFVMADIASRISAGLVFA
jgi:hypothetical protein